MSWAGRHVRWGWAVVAVVAAVASCGSDDAVTSGSAAATATTAPAAATAATEPAASEPAATEPSATEPAASEPTTGLLGLLATIPADLPRGTTRMSLKFGDLDAMSAAAGVTRPPSGTYDYDALVDWLQAMSSRPGGPASVVEPLFPEPLRPWIGDDEGGFLAEVGWSVADVRRYVDLSGDSRTSIIELAVDASVIGQVLGPPTDGVWTFGEEGDREPTMARPLGGTRQMGMRDMTLVWSNQAVAIEAWVAAGSPTMADDPSLGPVAVALDRAGAYAGYIEAPVSFEMSYRRSNPRADDAKVARVLEEYPIPDPFLIVGAGLRVRDGEPGATFVYVHVDDAAAQAGAPVLERVFRSGTSIRGSRPLSEMWADVSVSVEGPLVIVSLDGLADPGIVGELVLNGDVVISTR